MPYETEVGAPLFERDEDAAFLIEKVRDLAFPVIVARFENVTQREAEQRVREINVELASRGLPEFPPVRRRRALHE